METTTMRTPEIEQSALAGLSLEETIRQIRIDIIESVAKAGSGHPGGSLSAADILGVLYFEKMNIRPDQPNWPDRDRFVLSKGHAAPVLYACLAEKKYFPREELMTLRQADSWLQGHPDMKHIPGVDMSSGSLGQGLSAANGMALAAKLDGKSYNVYCVLGDGEIQEGQVWEAAMSAAHYQLGNLIAFLDHNGLQIDGTNDEVMSLKDIPAKFRAFGWEVIEIDGHNLDSIRDAIELAKATHDKPTMIIAQTIKGKGVSFMENQRSWHGTAPNAKQAARAIAELKGAAV